MGNKECFRVNVDKYDSNKSFEVVRPASLSKPQDNSVMFVTEHYLEQLHQLNKCNNCLVFVIRSAEVPESILSKHAIIPSDNPRMDYCKFYRDNGITNYTEPCEYKVSNEAFIADGASIGKECHVFPGAYIDKDVVMGDRCYIASGVKLIGSVTLGNNVVIKENTVIGADGLSTNRDEEGHPVTMPQFGGVTIKDNVIIGALTVIARGAIDDTIIEAGAKVDNKTFISHNVHLGEETFVVGETLMCGSSSTGKQCFIGGNSCIRDGISIGNRCMVGMGSNVLHDVEDNSVVVGNPAKFYKKIDEVDYE